jgi:hypothetical protein
MEDEDDEMVIWFDARLSVTRFSEEREREI